MLVVGETFSVSKKQDATTTHPLVTVKTVWTRDYEGRNWDRRPATALLHLWGLTSIGGNEITKVRELKTMPGPS